MSKLLKNKFFWIVFVLILIISLTVIYVKIVVNPSKEKEKPVVEESFILEEFNGFILYKDVTKYQKDLFNELKAVSPDFSIVDATGLETYLDVYSKNFVADVYTLSVKDESLNRLGGEQFIAEIFKENYKISSINDFYLANKYYRKSHKDVVMPEVSSLELVSINSTTLYVNSNAGIPNFSGIVPCGSK